VTRELREPWPREQRGGMALPNAGGGSGRVYLWFGADQRTPVLALTPIEVTEVEAG
jgi:hypothetical protein